MEIDIYGTGKLYLCLENLSATYNVRNLFPDIKRVIC